MNVLVLGGSRFIGRKIVDVLVQHGHRVTVFNRGRLQATYPKDVRTISGDRRTAGALTEVFAEVRYDAVIDNIAYSGTDVASLRSVAGGAMGSYILTSTAWICLGSGNLPAGRPVSEEDFRVGATPDLDAIRERLASQPLPDIARRYVLDKVAAEAAASEFECRKIVVRPCMISGADDHLNRVRFYADRIARGLPIGRHPRWLLPFQMAWVDDVARAVVRLAERQDLDGFTFNICPPEETTVAEMVAMAGRALGRDPQVVPLGDPLLEPNYMDGEPLSFFVSACFAGDLLQEALPGFRWRPAQEWIPEVAMLSSLS